MKPTTLAGAALLLLPGGLLALQSPTPEGKAAVPGRELGLSKTSVFETPSPPAVLDNRTEPAERPLLPRVYEGSPPLIPHGVADFLPITRDDNPCLTCHQLEQKEAGLPTPIPKSHYLDLRNAPTEPRDAIAGARHYCVTCHVAPTDAPPLVGSAFGR